MADRLKWIDSLNMDGEPNGSVEAEFRGLSLQISGGFLGITLSIIRHGPKPIHIGIPGCPSVKAAKGIARKEALKALKEEERGV